MNDQERRRGGVPPHEERISRVGVSLGRRAHVTLPLALLVVIALGVADWLTGPQLAMGIFYLVPVAVVAWTTTRKWSLLTCVVAGATWGVADLAAMPGYHNAFIPVWNTVTRLATFVVVAVLLSHLRVMAEHERALSRTDYVTGASNSRYFLEAAASLFDRAGDQRMAVTLTYIDLDNFKAINDEYGHSAGNVALRRVVTALKDATRETDLVGRLGGDEFAVMFLSPVDADPRLVARSVITRVSDELARQHPPISFSAGAVTITDPSLDVDDALAAADSLMFSVKRRGKHSFDHRVIDQHVVQQHAL